MHMIIRAIVYAKNEQEALFNAQDIFERLTENGHIFDYYQMFDNPGTPVSGKGRWGDMPAVVRADSKQGKKLIEDGMRFRTEQFKENMKTIREKLQNYTDDDILRGDIKELSMLFYYMHTAGEYRGHAIWLYDQDGEGIQTLDHLNDVLTKWKSFPSTYKELEKMNIYVVPADVHY